MPWSSTRAFLETYRKNKTLPGAMATVGRGMDPATYLASGLSAFTDGSQLGPHTLWRIYSMTKPITGIAAMILVDDGVLTLDQPVGELLPEWAAPTVLTDPENSLDARPATGAITIRHLLTHTAGLGYSITPPPLGWSRDARSAAQRLFGQWRRNWRATDINRGIFAAGGRLALDGRTRFDLELFHVARNSLPGYRGCRGRSV